MITYQMLFMEFSAENAGKWVAVKKGKIIESAQSLSSLLKKIPKAQNKSDLTFGPVPRGVFSGS